MTKTEVINARDVFLEGYAIGLGYESFASLKRYRPLVSEQAESMAEKKYPLPRKYRELKLKPSGSVRYNTDLGKFEFRHTDFGVWEDAAPFYVRFSELSAIADLKKHPYEKEEC